MKVVTTFSLFFAMFGTCAFGADRNPINHTLVYHATRCGVDAALCKIPPGKVGVVAAVCADYSNVPHKIAEVVDKPFKGMSDQAWG
ncbi:MAG: hypothetical protein LBR89_02585 [Holosporales bacterium]|jgi:hypothetical protein|nr:hypothetical protein [Holosporales bacterium]